LRFHRDFSIPVDTDILQANDGVHFRFPLATLVPLSSFFANICSTFQGKEDDKNYNRQLRFEKLEQCLRAWQAMPDGQPGFVKACEESGGCESYQGYDGNFNALRVLAADAVYAVFRAMNGVDVDSVVEPTIAAVVRCDICARRLAKCFSNALWSLDKKLKNTI
jgi:hypothetical protein